MVSWIIPIVRQSKTDLIHRQEMRPLRHGGSHFVNLQNGCLHDVRDASLVCESSKFLIAWRLVLSMKPWSYIWLEFGLFSTIIAIIRACACWALFVVTLTNTVYLIYVYIYIYMLCWQWVPEKPPIFESGARLSKTKHVISLKYHNSSNFQHLVKFIFYGVWVEFFCMKFQRHLWTFTQIFEPIFKISLNCDDIILNEAGQRKGRQLTSFRFDIMSMGQGTYISISDVYQNNAITQIKLPDMSFGIT